MIETIFKIIVYGVVILVVIDIILYLILKVKQHFQKPELVANEIGDVGAESEESTRKGEQLEIFDSVVLTENEKSRVRVVQPKKNIRA